jgi:predicted DNA-binding protein (MmcQ/YjbR family)
VSLADPHCSVRRICLALPEVEQRETWGDQNWRVRERIFLIEKRTGEGLSLWMKAPHGAQEVLLAADPVRFFAPPYLDPKGWLALRVDDDTDWIQVAALAARSYRLVAPKRSARTVPDP